MNYQGRTKPHHNEATKGSRDQGPREVLQVEIHELKVGMDGDISWKLHGHTHTRGKRGK